MSDEVDINEHELLLKKPMVLKALLKDHTRTAYEKKKCEKVGEKVSDVKQWNIVWATNNYTEQYGEGYSEKDEIREEKITGENRFIVRPRAVKEKEIQRQRSRDMAEVFTPAWVCNAQNNLIDEAWFGRKDVFNREYLDKEGVHRWEVSTAPIEFEEEPSRKSKKSWQDYVRDSRLEITCGEAPYIVSRYDAVTGLPMDLYRRIGLLDRKLRVVSENTQTSRDWLKWAQEAVMSVYGFEWQGDNLLLAREAVLFSVCDYYKDKFKKEMLSKSMEYFAYIISWNFWQMDGLKMVLPYSCENVVMTNLLGEVEEVKCLACAKGELTGHIGVKCVIRDWTKKRDQQKIEFEKVFSRK